MPSNGFSLHIDGLSDLLTDMNTIGEEYAGVIERAMNASTTQLRNAIQDNIIEKGITNTGSLVGSVTVIESSAEQGIIGVGELYGGAVEFGRPPGTPPPSNAIERWAQLKLGVPGLGFVIARKIGKEGTKPQPFVGPAFDDNQDFIQQQFDDAITYLVLALA